MPPQVSYILCATPRTGSTLLCGLLSSTGVLGRPESYFREPDEEMWAEQFLLPSTSGRVLDYHAFVSAAREAGSTSNGVFAARIMWGSIDPLIQRLDGTTSDLVSLEKALGTLAFVHLKRDGVLEQAVSWCRAEQTGYWQHGDIVSGPVHLDLHRLKGCLGEIQAHNAAWESWFQAQAVEPLVVTYEEVVSVPRTVVADIAAHVSVEVPTGWRPVSRHRQQADEVNAAQVVALRLALGSERP